MTEQEHETAARELRDLLSTSGITMDVAPSPNNRNTENETQKFACVLTDGHNTLATPWSCGSGVALCAFQDNPDRFAILETRRVTYMQAAKSLEGYYALEKGGLTDRHRTARRSIRAAYVPELFDVLSRILRDTASATEYDHWTDWAEDLGMLTEETTAQHLRNLENDFAQIQSQKIALRDMLGDTKLERAQELAAQL